MKRAGRTLLSALLLAAVLFSLPIMDVGAVDALAEPDGEMTSSLPTEEVANGEGVEGEAPPAEVPHYSVTYNTNGGTFPDGSQYRVQADIPEGGWVDILHETPVAEGNHFAGWYSSADGKTYWSGGGFHITTHTTFWATWVAVQMCSIRLHFNTEDNFVSTGRFQQGYKFDLTPYATHRQGYAFKGWATDPASEEIAFPPDAQVPLWGDTEVYAVWEKLEEPSPDASVPASSKPASSPGPEGSGPSSPPGESDGDESGGNAWVWLLILLVAAVAAAVVAFGVVSRKKHQREARAQKAASVHRQRSGPALEDIAQEIDKPDDKPKGSNDEPEGTI